MAKAVTHKLKVESHFLKAAHAGTEATAFAVKEAVKEGQRTARERIDSADLRRGYRVSSSLLKSEWHGLDGRIFFDEFYGHFFEYGTTYIPAMPFVRPGHRAMRKSFIEWMGADFEGWVSARAKVYKR